MRFSMRGPWGRLAVRCFLATALAWTSGAAVAQTLASYVVKGLPRAAMDRVAEGFEVVNRFDDGSYEVYVPHERRAEFLALAPAARLTADDIDADLKASLAKSADALAGYHTFATVESYLNDLVKAHPDLAILDTYGRSNESRPLYLLKLSSNVGDQDSGKKKLFFDAATHGDEIITTEVLISLIDELVAGHGRDPRLTAMLDKNELYFSLVVNPDGYVRRDRYDAGVDPNRAYPWPEQPNRVVATDSIQALMDLFAAKTFDGSITFHAYGRMLMFPWGYTTARLNDAAEYKAFDELTTRLAQGNRYRHGPIATTIYVAKGSSVDYYYWKYKTKALAVELASTKAPPAANIPSVVNEAREMTWGFIESFR